MQQLSGVTFSGRVLFRPFITAKITKFQSPGVLHGGVISFKDIAAKRVQLPEGTETWIRDNVTNHTLRWSINENGLIGYQNKKTDGAWTSFTSPASLSYAANALFLALKNCQEYLPRNVRAAIKLTRSKLMGPAHSSISVSYRGFKPQSEPVTSTGLMVLQRTA